MTFGSPEAISYEAIAEFFTNIRRGVRPEEDEIKTLYDNYVRIGGTPLQAITREEVRLVRVPSSPMSLRRWRQMGLKTASV